MTALPPPPAALSPEETAFFLDVDGTLTDIIPDPAKVRLTADARAVLQQLFHRSEGAVALVSGRSITQLDLITDPLRLPVVGVHGLETRLSDGALVRRVPDIATYTALVALVRDFAGLHGLLVETKPGAVALHFRRHPDLATDCLHFMQQQAQRDTRLTLLTGKMVLELVFGQTTKGNAIAKLMQSPPFLGRTALFAGDDLTDETGFACVNRLDGISVKIGEGDTCARHNLPHPAALIRYLCSLVKTAEQEPEHFPDPPV